MAQRTPYALRRRATYALVLLVGLGALGVLGARGASLWLDGQQQRVVQLLERSTGGEVALDAWSVGSRGVNPVVRARGLQISFAGARALRVEHLDVELDLLESLARSAPIARGLTVAGAQLALEADERGVRLRGATPQPLDDTLLRMLADTDAVNIADLAVDLLHVPSGSHCQLNSRVQLRGVGGRHAGNIYVDSGAASLQVDVDVRGAALAWRNWQGDARVQWDLPAAPACAQLPLPDALADARLDGLAGNAEVHFARGEISTVARVSGAGEALHNSLQLSDGLVRAVWRNGRLRVQADLDGLRVAGAGLFVPGGTVEVQAEQGVWRLIAPDTALAVLSDHLLRTGLLKDVHERWVRSLDPIGALGATHVRLDANGWSLQAPFRNLHMQAYKGAPGIVGAAGRVLMMPGAVRMRLDETPADLSFPEVFAASAPHYERIGGSIDIVFEPGWVAIIGRQIEADSAIGQVHGDFVLWRPDARAEQVLFLDVKLDRGTPLAINHYIPKGLAANLQNWLVASVVNGNGEITAGRLVYHGHVLPPEAGLKRRQAALGASLHGVDFRYHPDWPVATVIDGAMVVDVSGVSARARRFSLAGHEFVDGFGRLPKGSDILRLRGEGNIDAVEGLKLLQATPISKALGFVQDGWQVSGPVAMQFDGRVPLGGAQVDPVVHVDIDARGVELRNPALSLEVDAINGRVAYDYPTSFDAPALTARFLDRLVEVRVETPEQVRIHVEGLTDVRAVGRWTGQGLINAASGELSYAATVDLPHGDKALSLRVRSNLLGVDVALPEPVGKTAASPRPSEIVMSWPAEHVTLLTYDYGVDVRGVSELRDGHISRAVVALAGAEPLLPEDSRVSVRGSLYRASMDEWLAAAAVLAGKDAGMMPPMHLDNLQIDRLLAFDRVFEEIRLDALDLRDEWRFQFANAEFSGRARVPDAGTIEARLEYMHIPEGEPGTSSLIYVDFGAMPDLNVTIDELRIGGDEYGAWAFDLRATQDELRLENVVGGARGVQVGTDDSRASLVWSKASGIERTRFDGLVQVHDVAAAQVAWGLEASLVAEDLTADAHLSWAGAPDAFVPEALSGSMTVRSGSGRFEQIETGANALRVLGIFNFAALSRRARLDFSDVLGKGLSFDTINAELVFEDGILRLPKPALVEGTGSILRITGEVDLQSWVLDNEVVLTLPVSRSLPWYAAYAALANPLAGAGVLVAGRLLRDQLDSFSSARYRVTGTLDDPKLTFINIFDVAPPDVADAGDPES